MRGFLARNTASREAKQFQKTVRLGTTYYAVVTVTGPKGKDIKLLDEWTFDKRSPITGNPMCGPCSAEQVWLSHGPLTPRRPHGLMTIREYDAANNKDADPKFLADLQARIAEGASLVH